jgi:hypothetical protein
LIAKRYAAKNNQAWEQKQERAPLDLCIDPQFEIYKKFITQRPPTKQATSIYDEVDPKTYLDFYGRALPTRVDSWNLGPAEFKRRFTDT